MNAISAAAIGPATANQSPFNPSAGIQKPGTLLVRAKLENIDLPLRPDMTGQARISCDRHTLIGLLAWRAKRIFTTEFWAWL